jgi:hypothetical protein
VKDAGWADANIVEMIALTAQFPLTNFMNNAVQTPIDFPAVSPANAGGAHARNNAVALADHRAAH